MCLISVLSLAAQRRSHLQAARYSIHLFTHLSVALKPEVFSVAALGAVSVVVVAVVATTGFHYYIISSILNL